MSHRAALSIAFLLSACVVADGDDPSVSTHVQTIEGSCDEFLCGANSPLIGGLPFWEVDTELGAAHALSITKVTDPLGFVGKLVVDGAQVTFVATGRPPIGRERLIGTEIVITAAPTTRSTSPRIFVVTILDYNPVAYYPGVSGPPIESYRLAWVETTPGTLQSAAPNPKDVCSSLETDEDGMVNGNAIIYGGERFNATTGAIVASDAAAGSWVNIACGGDLRAKMSRMGRIPATGLTTVEERQAAVWMFSARYCGTKPYTHQGVKLAWRLRGDASLMPSDQTPEAIWTGKGAACLSTPRAYDRAAIECAASLPECTDEMFGKAWQKLGVLASALPPPPPPPAPLPPKP